MSSITKQLIDAVFTDGRIETRSHFHFIPGIYQEIDDEYRNDNCHSVSTVQRDTRIPDAYERYICKLYYKVVLSFL